MKSNNTLFYVTCLSLLFLFNGCDEGSELSGEIDAGWKPIEVASCRAQLEVNGVTRALGLTEIKTGTLGLYRKATNGYTALNNVRYTYKEATTATAARWESDDATKAIYVNAKTADIYAVYPYMEINGNPTNGHQFDGTSVTGMHQQRYYSDSRNEVMISGDSPANNRAPRLQLEMKHIYSRLSLHIENSSEQTYIIKSLTLQPKAEYTTEAKVDISASSPMPVKTVGSTQGYSFPFEQTDAVYTTGIAPAAADESVEMIWIPQSFTADMEITIVVGIGVGAQQTLWTVTATLPQAHLSQLLPATRYILPLKISSFPATLTIGDVTIKNWNATDMGNISAESESLITPGFGVTEEDWGTAKNVGEVAAERGTSITPGGGATEEEWGTEENMGGISAEPAGS